jgi:LPS export ABC transporter permease LptG/LPS export ABC transporter permease LptF
MFKIDKLLYRSIVPPFLISLSVLTFILLVRSLGTLSELLITRNASLGVILTITGAILPATLIYSLPISFLIGTLIGISGLSGESQITALRAGGVPIRTLLRPVLLFGIAVGLLTAWLTLVIFPRTNDVIGRAKDRVSVAQATAQIQPRVFNGGDEDFPDIVFYLNDIAVDKQHWSRVFLSDHSDPKSPRTVMALSGSWVTDSSKKHLQLHLERGASYSIDPADPSKDNVSLFDSTDIPISLSPRFSTDSDNRTRKVAEQSTPFLWRDFRKAALPLKVEELIELNRRIALPFSIVPFALLGLSLAVTTPKGGRTSGFAISLALVLLFYMLFFNGIRLALVGKVTPWFGVWGANFFLAVLGLAFFYRVEQSHTIGQWISHALSKFRWSNQNKHFQLNKLRTRISELDESLIQSSKRVARFRFPKVLDIYISRGFFTYFCWSLTVCCTLFVLFTLFDLLDDIIQNKIPASTVVNYFTFFTPQILMLVVPMSVLLGVLINFAILEKNCEITAIKAGGWSLYRIAVPVFLISFGLCIGLFLLQDYVLPYSNALQDQLHNQIKGKPPQKSMPERKWILGESSRIYNYEYFDPNSDSFVDLNVYDIDLGNAKILRRTHAAFAHIDKGGLWTLENGWVRDYQPQSGFRRIGSEIAKFPEKAVYFKKEIFQPKESSKRTYAELRNYIKYLMKSGYNATELKVELYKKTSFPISCLVMALLGVPFSFSTGKKGAFFGIGASIAIAISYWGISGAFETMGTYGILMPVLAAWAPNLLFGSAGLVLLFTIRT